MMPKKRPIHPGVIVREDILKELGLTQEALARAVGVSRRTVNELVNGKRSVTAEMALKLGRFTKTSPEMWLNLQNAVDLWDAYHTPELCIECIKPFEEALPVPSGAR